MGNVRIENGDSKAYRLDIRVSGSSSVLEIRASTTATYSWSGGSHDAEIRGGGVAFPGSVMKVSISIFSSVSQCLHFSVNCRTEASTRFKEALRRSTNDKVRVR